MISDRIKQRLIGLGVLVALAVIFIPVLFNFQPSKPLDQASQIPPAPDILPVDIAEPIPPAVDNEVPDPDDIFTLMEIDENEEASTSTLEKDDNSVVAERELPQQTTENIRAEPEVAPKLLDNGLPESWVVQVGSFSELETAKKQVSRLQKAQYKAFHQQGSVDGKQVFRVFVGPFISRNSAEQEKKLIDKSLGVSSFILSYEP